MKKIRIIDKCCYEHSVKYNCDSEHRNPRPDWLLLDFGEGEGSNSRLRIITKSKPDNYIELCPGCGEHFRTKSLKDIISELIFKNGELTAYLGLHPEIAQQAYDICNPFVYEAENSSHGKIDFRRKQYCLAIEAVNKMLLSQEAQKYFLEHQDHLVSWTSSEWTKLETEVFRK